MGAKRNTSMLFLILRFGRLVALSEDNTSHFIVLPRHALWRAAEDDEVVRKIYQNGFIYGLGGKGKRGSSYKKGIDHVYIVYSRLCGLPLS